MKAILTLVAALAFAASPYFVPGFSGFNPDLYPNPQIDPPVQPAGYAFAIWGLIYVWLILHAGFGLLKRDVDPDWDAPRWPLFISLAIGTSWLAVAERDPVLATILIWVMLAGALAALYLTRPGPDRWLLQAPVAIYGGWLTAASCASLGLLGAGYGVWTDEIGWAYIGLGIAVAVGAVVQITLRRAPEYGLTVVWAVIAIAVQNWGSNMPVALTAMAGAVLMLALALRALQQTKRSAPIS